MCLITVAPKGAQSLDWNVLNHSAKQNADGWGVAWWQERSKRWTVFKSLKPETLKNVLDRAPRDVPVVIHQRYATHGKVQLTLSHPFEVTKDVLLFHNGVISGTRADKGQTWKDKEGKWWTTKDDNVSDTLAYVEDELRPLIEAAGGYQWLRHPMGKEAIERRIGWGNVLTIVTAGNPEPIIINEKRGDWEGDVFYSNSYSRPSRYYYDYYDSDYGSDFGGKFDRYKGGKGSLTVGEKDASNHYAALSGGWVDSLTPEEEVDLFDDDEDWTDEELMELTFDEACEMLDTTYLLDRWCRLNGYVEFSKSVKTG